MASKVSLLSSTVFTTDDVNISHSGVLGREFKRMKDRILLSTKISIPARQASTVQREEMCPETVEVPSYVLLKSYLNK